MRAGPGATPPGPRVFPRGAGARILLQLRPDPAWVAWDAAAMMGRVAGRLWTGVIMLLLPPLAMPPPGAGS